MQKRLGCFAWDICLGVSAYFCGFPQEILPQVLLGALCTRVHLGLEKQPRYSDPEVTPIKKLYVSVDFVGMTDKLIGKNVWREVSTEQKL